MTALAFIVVMLGTLSVCFSADAGISRAAPKAKPQKGCPLEVYLMDKWGDGWNGAKLSVSGGPKPKSYSPKPGSSGTTVSIPLAPLGQSVMSIANGPKGGVPKEYWEVWWSFSVDGQAYVGGYDTVVTLTCLWQSPTDWVIQVVEVKNAEEQTCSRCTKPKPKPKPAKVISNGDGGETLLYAGTNGETLSIVMTQQELEAASVKQTSLYEEAVSAAETEAKLESIEGTQETAEPDSEASSVNVVPDVVSSVITNVRRALDLDSPSKPKPAPKKLPYVAMLLNTGGQGWFDGTGISTYYSISDSTRYGLVTSGTMCGSFSEQLCEVQLADGDYILRVGGNGDTSKDDNTWEFCGVTGGTQTELSFSVAKGKCSATTDLVSVFDQKKKVKKYTEEDDDTPDVTDDDKLPKMDGEKVVLHFFSTSSPAGVMVFASASIGAFVIGFIAVNAIVFVHLRRISARKASTIVSTEITNEKLLAANGLTIIKEGDLNSSRHKLVSSLDL